MTSLGRYLVVFVAAACALARTSGAQGLTGALIGTVKDQQGGVLAGARVSVTSPALIGGRQALTTSTNGQLRFPTLPPGTYVLDVELPGFAAYHEEEIRIGAGGTIERAVELKLASVADAVIVSGSGSHIEARHPGFGTRFAVEDLEAIPMRRFSPFDWVKTAPGISPTSPAGTRSYRLSVRVWTRISFSSTARTSLRPATASRDPTRVSTSFRNCRSNR